MNIQPLCNGYCRKAGNRFLDGSMLSCRYLLLVAGAAVGLMACGTERVDNVIAKTELIENTAPVANIGVAQQVQQGTVVALSGRASYDADGDPLSYFWQLLSVPDGSRARLSSVNGVTCAFTPDLAGEYVIQLIVNDGTVDSLKSYVTIISTSADITPTSINI